MARLDYGFWVGNFFAVALVAMALVYFVSLLRSVMNIDPQDFQNLQ